MTKFLSDNYQTQIRLLHSTTDWGNGGNIHVPKIEYLLQTELRGKIKTVLDYGCGKGHILDKLRNSPAAKDVGSFSGYDPGIPEKAALPSPADLVICTDVLEHVEPAHLAEVMQHIRSLTLVAAYFMPHTGPAKRILPDGRNAHLIQKPSGWWRDKLAELYSVVRRDGISEIRPVFVCYP